MIKYWYLLLLSSLILLACNREVKVAPQTNLVQYDSINFYIKNYDIDNASALWQKLDSTIDKRSIDSSYWVHKQVLVHILLNASYFDSAKTEILHVLNQIDSVQYEDIYINLKRLKSISELQLGNYNQSITHAFEVLPYYEKRQIYHRICGLKSSIAWAYFNLMDWEKSKKYILESINIASSNHLDNFLPDYNQRLATIFAGQLQYDTLQQLQKFDSAIYYYNISLSLLDTAEASWDLSNLYLNKGSLYTLMHMDKEAIFNYQRALQVNEKLNDQQGIANCYTNLGLTYINLKQYDKAEKVLLASEKIAEQMKDINLLTTIHKNLAVLYKKINKYEASANYYEKYVSVFFIEIENKNAAQSKALSTKYEKEITEKEIQHYKNEQLMNQYKLLGLSALLVFIILLSVVVAYIFIQRNKNKKIIDQMNREHEKKLIEQETKENERNRISRNLHDNLGAYASSILNKIKMIENDVDAQFKEVELIELRHTAQQILYNLKSIVIDLNQKSTPFLDFMDQLKTELIRLVGAFPHIDFNISEQIEFNPIWSPESQFHLKSILFEMVNNALKHSQASIINLLIEESSSQVLIKVADNGVYNKSIEKSYGNGMANISSRVKMLGGQLSVFENEFGGTSVQVYLPKM